MDTDKKKPAVATGGPMDIEEMDEPQRQTSTYRNGKSIHPGEKQIIGRPYWPRIPGGEYLAAAAQQFANKFRDLKFLVMRGGL